MHEVNRRYWNEVAERWERLEEEGGVWQRCPREPELAFAGGALGMVREVAGSTTGKDVCDPQPNLKVILIGGSSHVGKSTVSESLAETLGWSHLSTDRLAAHPGRPWRPAPEKVLDRVAEHYLRLSVDELIEDVLRHYRVIVWPKVEAIIASHSTDTSTTGIVLEGSALWPEFATGLDFNKVAAVWLTASDEVFRQRIYVGSRYSSKSTRERKMIDKFLARTLAYNAGMVEAVSRHGFMLVDVQRYSVTEVAERCLSSLRTSRMAFVGTHTRNRKKV